MKNIHKIPLFIILIPIIIMGSAIFAKATGPIINSVTITDENTGTTASATSVLAFDPSSPILITKSPDKTEINVGESVSYTVQITNVSTDASTFNNINLVDDYPQDILRINDLGGITGVVGFTCNTDADNITCNIGSLAPTESAEFTAHFTAVAPGVATNTATVTDTDGNTNNIEVDINVLDDGNPILMTNVPDNGNVDINDEVLFTTVISNTSQINDLTDVVVSHEFPNELFEFLSATPPAGTTCNEFATKIECTTGTLNAGDSETIEFRFRATSAGLATLQSTLSEPGGNTFTIEASVNILSSGDLLFITKEPSSGKVIEGENVFFTATVKNRSETQTLTNVLLVDDFPEDLLFLENVTSDKIDCQKDAVEIRCNAEELAPQETATIVSRYVTVGTGQAVNSITATADPEQSGSVNSSVVIEDAGTVIRIKKIPSETIVDSGEQITYTVEIENASDVLTLHNIDITDTFPTDLLQIESVSTTGEIDCTYDVSKIECTVDTLGSGEDNAVSFTSTFTTLRPGLAINQVNAISDSGQTANKDAIVIIADVEEPFVIIKTPEKKTIELGEEILYTIEVQNTHTSAIEDITLVDDFPQNQLQLLDITRNGFICTNTENEITCTADSIASGETKSITTRYLSLAPGTATNTATISRSSGKRQSVSENIVIEDVGNIFLISKSPNKGTIEVGEEVDFEIKISNRTQAQVVPDVNIVDDFPEDLLEIIDTTESAGLVCQSDFSEIRCNIQDMQPGSSYTLNTKFRGIAAGTAANFLTITSDITEPGNIGSSVQINEPSVQDLVLSSTCEGESVLIGQECYLQVLAYFDFSEPQDVSKEATYLNFQNIGTLLANVLTTTTVGTSVITATYDGKTSNSITIDVTEDLGVGMDPEGNIISHFAARTSGGTDDTLSVGSPVGVGVDSSGFNVVAEYNQLIFNGMGGDQTYNWFLENRSLGSIRDVSSDTLCPDTSFGMTCSNTDSIAFESGEAQGSVLLQVYDSQGNQINITIHILEPSIEEIEIRDEEGNPILERLETVKQEDIFLTAQKVLADGSVDPNAEDELIWEFSHNGGEWTTGSAAGNISRGVLSPIETGTFAIRAKTEQKIALPGEKYITEKITEIVSKEITVQVGDPIPFIDSLRTAGNEGFAQGTSDTLYARVRHIDGVSQIGDVELSMIRGEYEDPTKIPESVQYFFIDILEKRLSDGPEKTVLAEIDFSIPFLSDITQGMHTLVMTITNNEGIPEEDVVIGLLPIFIGEPTAGDADLNGEVDLVDAVITMRFLHGSETPTPLQNLALDYDGKNGVTIADYVTLFRAFLRTFLQ